MVSRAYFSFIDDPNLRRQMRDEFGCRSGKKQIEIWRENFSRIKKKAPDNAFDSSKAAFTTRILKPQMICMKQLVKFFKKWMTIKLRKT